MKIKKIYKQILALIAIPFILSGCSKKSDCDVKARHVHLYTKNARNAVIQTYLNSTNDDEIRVRQRGLNGNYIYTKTIKRKVSDIRNNRFPAHI